jgi:hypothetical protein
MAWAAAFEFWERQLPVVQPPHAWLLRLYSYLGFTRFAYASYLPYMYDRTVLTVYRTHLRTLPLSRYLAALVSTRLILLTFLFRLAFPRSCGPFLMPPL